MLIYSPGCCHDPKAVFNYPASSGESVVENLLLIVQRCSKNIVNSSQRRERRKEITIIIHNGKPGKGFHQIFMQCKCLISHNDMRYFHIGARKVLLSRQVERVVLQSLPEAAFLEHTTI